MAINSASRLAIIGFSLISISLLFLIIGFLAVRNKRYHLHKFFMLFATISNTLFLISYITRYIQEGNTPFPGPNWFFNFVYIPILSAHIITALFSIYFVLRQILTGWRGQEINSSGNLILRGPYRESHQRFGKKAVYVWGISFLGGISVFLMLYVIY
jgi:putative membrane protein